MAPLGEWSLEATVLDGARGMPGTVTSTNYPPRQDIPAVGATPRRRRPRHRRRTGHRSCGFCEQSAVTNRVAVALGERAQLAQGKRPAAAALGDDDPRPQAFGAREFTCVAGAQPPTRACPADGLGCFIRSGRPSFGIASTRAYRRLFPLRCVHRRCSFARSAASRRDGAKRSAQTVAMQRFRRSQRRAISAVRPDGAAQMGPRKMD